MNANYVLCLLSFYLKPAKNSYKKVFWIMDHIRENRSYCTSFRFLIIRIWTRIYVRSRLCPFSPLLFLLQSFLPLILSFSHSFSFFADEMELTSSEINLPHNLDEMPLICWLPEPKIENFSFIFFLFLTLLCLHTLQL